MSRAAREAVSRVREISADASSASMLGQRLLAVLRSAVGFDDAEVLAIDGSSLLFTRLLAYHGDRLPHFAFFLRDVYLVSQEPEWLRLDRLLTEGRGSAAFHERFEMWLRATPPKMPQAEFTQFWRELQSPPGGGVRYGIAHRHRWLVVLQLARWEAGPGFSPSNLELLDRLAPTLGRAFAARLLRFESAGAGLAVPEAGHLLFNGQRRLVSLDEPAAAWLDRIPDDGLRPFGVDVPVAVQSALNMSFATRTPVTNHVVDRHAVSVTIQARPAHPFSAQRPALQEPGVADSSGSFFLSVGRTAWNSSHPAIAMLTARQRQVAEGIAAGLSDSAIAGSLGIGAATVHDAVTTLHRVVGAPSRGSLVAALNRS